MSAKPEEWETEFPPPVSEAKPVVEPGKTGSNAESSQYAVQEVTTKTTPSGRLLVSLL